MLPWRASISSYASLHQLVLPPTRIRVLGTKSAVVHNLLQAAVCGGLRVGKDETIPPRVHGGSLSALLSNDLPPSARTPASNLRGGQIDWGAELSWRFPLV